MTVSMQASQARLRMPTAVPADVIWRLSVDQYHAMIRSGILTDDDPVELLEGWLVAKMPKNPPHSVATQLTRKALEAILCEGWYVDTQEPITLSQSEPEPDVVVVRGNPRQYADRHPGPQDIALVVEIADTTLRRDQGAKKRTYACEGIPVYWILNLSEQELEVYTTPSRSLHNPNYRHEQHFARNDRVSVSIAGQDVGTLAVADMLP